MIYDLFLKGSDSRLGELNIYKNDEEFGYIGCIFQYETKGESKKYMVVKLDYKGSRTRLELQALSD